MMTDIAQDDRGNPIPAGSIPVSGWTTHLPISTTSAATVSLAGGLYRVVSDVPCFLAGDSDTPSALVTDMPLAADDREYFNVKWGHKVAAITAAGTGTLSLTRMG